MKQADLKEKSSVFVIGKGIIVFVLTGIASLSFLLGFLVGKTSRPPEMYQLSDISAEVSQKGDIPVSPAQEILPQQADPLQGELRASYDAGKTPAGKTIPAAPETQGALNTKKHDEAPSVSATNKYTVQIGAFRSASDAEALRLKLDKKGYKTFLMESKTKKNESLYKVAVGSFSTRNTAERLAAKIKKSEGLKTFVTLR